METITGKLLKPVIEEQLSSDESPNDFYQNH